MNLTTRDEILHFLRCRHYAHAFAYVIRNQIPQEICFILDCRVTINERGISIDNRADPQLDYDRWVASRYELPWTWRSIGPELATKLLLDAAN